jgi:hypothetical protein
MNLKALWRGLTAGGLALSLLAGGTAAPAGATNLRFADPAMEATWTRTDSLVANGQVQRSWYWGPAPGLIVREPYAEAPGGTRVVEYFDKSRMEINNPNGDRTSKFFVTNGLLSVEMISGKIAVGNNAYQNSTPATIPVASDSDDTVGPTYKSLQGVSNTPLGDHPAANRVNSFATATINRAGTVGNDASKSGDATKIAYFEPTTKHNVPKAFWTFLNQVGPVSVGGAVGQANLSDPWTFTTGLPISEAYWAQVQIAGQRTSVLIQAFERRVLTYIPSNPAAWQVQMNNAGQQYFTWRYGGTPTLLRDSLARMDGAPSYHASSTMDLVDNGATQRFANQETDFGAPNKVRLFQTSVGLTGLLNSQTITIGASGWVSATDTNNTWVKIDPTQVGTDPGALNIASLLGVMQDATNLEAVGEETIGGVATTHLRMTLNLAGVPTVRGLAWTAATGEVWVAKDTGYLQKLVANLTLDPSKAVRSGVVIVTATFRDFGKPVTINPPL